MALAATKVKQAKPREKAYKIYDERGLFLIVKPNGSKLWRFKYRFAGKYREISMGFTLMFLWPRPANAGIWRENSLLMA